MGFTGIVELWLENNSIKKLRSGAFDGLHKLRHLLLSGNNIMQLQEGWWNGLVALETVDLSQVRA